MEFIALSCGVNEPHNILMIQSSRILEQCLGHRNNASPQLAKDELLSFSVDWHPTIGSGRRLVFRVPDFSISFLPTLGKNEAIFIVVSRVKRGIMTTLPGTPGNC